MNLIWVQQMIALQEVWLSLLEEAQWFDIFEVVEGNCKDNCSWKELVKISKLITYWYSCCPEVSCCLNWASICRMSGFNITPKGVLSASVGKLIISTDGKKFWILKTTNGVKNYYLQELIFQWEIGKLLEWNCCNCCWAVNKTR